MTVCAVFTILFQLLYTYCFFLIAPAFGILLYQSQVLFSLILGVIFFRSERMLMNQSRTILGMLLAVAGAVVVILFQKGGVELSLSIGILMALGAAISWSFVGVSLRKGLEGAFSPVFIVTMVFSHIVVYLTPITLLSGDWIIGNPGPVHWFFLVGSGLLGIAGGQGIFYRLLPRLGLVTLASVQLLVPFITGIFSFLLFREEVTLLQVLGGLLLLAGCRIILVQKSKLGQAEETSPSEKEIEAV
jgi:drug/metabolite transporter (DMT)-like permease